MLKHLAIPISAALFALIPSAVMAQTFSQGISVNSGFTNSQFTLIENSAGVEGQNGQSQSITQNSTAGKNSQVNGITLTEEYYHGGAEIDRRIEYRENYNGAQTGVSWFNRNHF